MMMPLYRGSMHPPLLVKSGQGHHEHMNLCLRQHQPNLPQGLLHSEQCAEAVVCEDLMMIDMA